MHQPLRELCRTFGMHPRINGAFLVSTGRRFYSSLQCAFRVFAIVAKFLQSQERRHASSATKLLHSANQNGWNPSCPVPFGLNWFVLRTLSIRFGWHCVIRVAFHDLSAMRARCERFFLFARWDSQIPKVAKSTSLIFFYHQGNYGHPLEQPLKSEPRHHLGPFRERYPVWKG